MGNGTLAHDLGKGLVHPVATGMLIRRAHRTANLNLLTPHERASLTADLKTAMHGVEPHDGDYIQVMEDFPRLRPADLNEEEADIVDEAARNTIVFATGKQLGGHPLEPLAHPEAQKLERRQKHKPPSKRKQWPLWWKWKPRRRPRRKRTPEPKLESKDRGGSGSGSLSGGRTKGGSHYQS